MMPSKNTRLCWRRATEFRASVRPSGNAPPLSSRAYRTRDAGFRIFRNEKLERYKTLFDLAAQYAFMAAQAYDYETGC